MKTKREVLSYLMHCITESEADGYQSWEDSSGNVPDHMVPDDVSHDDKSTISIRKGDRVFLVKVTIPRGKQ